MITIIPIFIAIAIYLRILAHRMVRTLRTAYSGDQEEGRRGTHRPIFIGKTPLINIVG